ncbi:hypothetical protein GCM10007937_26620 [Mesorhizobium albiziae]|nr:hypothetical protein [Mesorhizobium albiziae]GLS30953.1 hypothetical protein GCM10007937_26620 [Mesorhizobium albiziae]
MLGLPIWMGQPSSVANRVLERLDAFLYETDRKGRMPAAGKVALVAIVGNEDAAHACHAAFFRRSTLSVSLSPLMAASIGQGRRWAISTCQAAEKVVEMLKMAVSNAAHLARLLKAQNYEGVRSVSPSPGNQFALAEF